MQERAEQLLPQRRDWVPPCVTLEVIGSPSSPTDDHYGIDSNYAWDVRRGRGAVANITLTRPDRLNAFTREDILELKVLLEEISRDSNIWVVALTGAGRAFAQEGTCTPWRADSRHYRISPRFDAEHG